MQNHTDTFIHQALRNWAASQQPSDKVKARLMLLAAARNSSQSMAENEPMMARSSRQYILNISQKYYLLPSEQIIEPINQTRLWLLQISPPLLRYMA